MVQSANPCMQKESLKDEEKLEMISIVKEIREHVIFPKHQRQHWEVKENSMVGTTSSAEKSIIKPQKAKNVERLLSIWIEDHTVRKLEMETIFLTIKEKAHFRPWSRCKDF